MHTSSMEKQELLLLETTLGNLHRCKEEIVMAPPAPGRAANGLIPTLLLLTVVLLRVLRFLPTLPLLGGGMP